MTITTVYIMRPSGKMMRRFLIKGSVGRVFVSITGHTRAYAIHKAFKEFTRPF
jgi:hypothetical protein